MRVLNVATATCLAAKDVPAADEEPRASDDQHEEPRLGPVRDREIRRDGRTHAYSDTRTAGHHRHHRDLESAGDNPSVESPIVV